MGNTNVTGHTIFLREEKQKIVLKGKFLKYFFGFRKHNLCAFRQTEVLPHVIEKDAFCCKHSLKITSTVKRFIPDCQPRSSVRVRLQTQKDVPHLRDFRQLLVPGLRRSRTLLPSWWWDDLEVSQNHKYQIQLFTSCRQDTWILNLYLSWAESLQGRRAKQDLVKCCNL